MILEAVIILPLLIILTFGAIEYGLAFRDSASVAAATRSGARTASAMPGAATPAGSSIPGFADSTRTAVNSALGDLTHSTPVTLVIYQADPNTGNPVSGTLSACGNCFVYTWNTSSKAFPATTSNGAGSYWTTAAQTADICAGRTDAIGVYVKAHQNFITGLFGSGADYSHKTVMQLEPAGSDLCG